GARQAIEVGQHAGAIGVQFEVELPTAAQLEQIQRNAPPRQEAALVDDAVLVARVGKTIQPGIEVGIEVANGLDQGLTDAQGRPALRFWCRLWVRIKATLSRCISLRSRLRRGC